MNRPHIAGFFQCDVDSDAFYAQKAPLYPGKYQRWILVLPHWQDDKPLTSEFVQERVGQFLRDSKLGLWDYRAVKVLAFTLKAPDDYSKAAKVVSPMPQLKSGPLSSAPAHVFYAAIEFWYDGSLNEVAWPWLARGFAIQCPEDTLGGLVAVMPPIAAMAPPTILEESTKPLNDAAIELHDGVRDAIKDVADKIPENPFQIGTVMTVLAWSMGALVLYHFHQSAKAGRRYLGA